MNKKIIAVICAVIMIASVFTACGKKNKLYIANINGKDIAVVTNENNEIVTDENGKVAFYVTQESGETATRTDGSADIKYVDQPSYLEHPNGTVSHNVFTMPIMEGWYFDQGSKKLVKKDTDAKCYILGDYTVEIGVDDKTYVSVINEMLYTNGNLIKEINDGKHKDIGAEKATINENNVVIDGFDADVYVFDIYGKDNKIIHHAESIYINIDNKEVHKLDYVCMDGVGYDKDFDFTDWASKNVKVSVLANNDKK